MISANPERCRTSSTRFCIFNAEWLADHPGPVVLSNQATGRIVKLYRKLGFTLRFLDAPRRISCNGDRSPAREVLAVKDH
jgi:DNA adenine methylase